MKKEISTTTAIGIAAVVLVIVAVIGWTLMNHPPSIPPQPASASNNAQTEQPPANPAGTQQVTPGGGTGSQPAQAGDKIEPPPDKV